MKILFGATTGIVSQLLLVTSAFAQASTRSATTSPTLPPAGVSWPTILVLTIAVFLIFAGAIKFFKAFE